MEKRKQERISHGKRLKAMADKRREEKLQQNKEQVECMKQLLERNLPSSEFEEEVISLGYTNAKDFHSELNRIQKAIDSATKKPDQV